MKEYASDQSRIFLADLSLMNRRIFDGPLVNESSRNKLKRIVPKIWTAALRRFYIFQREGLRFIILKLSVFVFFYFVTIRLREVSHQYPWLVTGVFFHMSRCCVGLKCLTDSNPFIGYSGKRSNRTDGQSKLRVKIFFIKCKISKSYCVNYINSVLATTLGKSCAL